MDYHGGESVLMLNDLWITVRRSSETFRQVMEKMSVKSGRGDAGRNRPYLAFLT
jgi:hypothetical protein